MATLLQHGADVRIVDDSGLTCVDVAKTKRVKNTLREAWTEVTQGTTPDLKPVRTPETTRRSSQSNGVSAISQNRAKKGGGEVIFDVSIAVLLMYLLTFIFNGVKVQGEPEKSISKRHNNTSYICFKYG